MSDTLANLRRKIDGAVKLESVVRTMKALAASSIGQYEAAVKALADYERSVQLGLSLCFRQSGLTPSLSRPGSSAKTTGAIVFGSDQGLVGQFNEAMAGFVRNTLEAVPGEKKVWAVGERIYGRLADAGLTMVGQFSVPGSVNAIASLVGQLQIAVEAQESSCATIDVFYTNLAPGAQYQPVSQRLLPLNAQWQTNLVKIRWPTKSLPELCGSREATLRAFVREYLFITLFKACAESLASENACRLAAMQRAEKNIDSLMTELNRTFYRLRQSSIDEELFDVIAGFNALSSKTSGTGR